MYADHPEFPLTEMRRFARDLLRLPIARLRGVWCLPVELRAVTASALRAQLDRGAPRRPRNGESGESDVMHPLVIAWRAGSSDAQHLWYTNATDAQRRGISRHELSWGVVECTTHFRMLSHFTPRSIALVVVTFALERQLLRPIELQPLLGTLPRAGRLSSETRAQLEAHACMLN